SVIHPCVRRVVEVLVVDDRGGTLLAVSRVALTARRDDDLSETLPMLALVAMVPLVAIVAFVAMVSLLALRPFGAVLPVLPRPAVLAATDVGGSGAVIYPRPTNEYLGVDGDGRALLTSREHISRVGRIDELLSEAAPVLTVLSRGSSGSAVALVALRPLE